MAIQDTDEATRKDAEKGAGIPIIPRYRERICIVCGFLLGLALLFTLRYMKHNPKVAFLQFKKVVYYYDIFVAVLTLIVELYSLSYYHPTIIFCFPKTCFPKCACADWAKLIWYILLASPNYIWCRRSPYGIAFTAMIGGIGVIYFINILVATAYIDPKLREYEEKLDLVGKAAGDGGDA